MGGDTAPLLQKVLEQGRLGLGGHASSSHRARWAVSQGPVGSVTGPSGQCHRAQWAVMVGTWRTGWGPTVSGKQEAQDLLLDGSGQGRGGLWSLGCQVSDLGSGRHVVPSLRGGY